MRVDVLTLFTEAFAGPLDVSIVGRAQREELLSVFLHDIRNHALDKHRSVDDTPFGGGQGMVMRVDVLDRALAHVRGLAEPPGRAIYLTPQGRLLDDSLVRELAREPRLLLVCGRYEGVDQRFVDHLADDEVSIGDYVLTGGELPAMVLIDAVTRHLPGALGDAASSEDESHAGGLLEHPQYTRPAEYRGWPVPSVLLGGNHAEIERWKVEQRIERTRNRRPDLLTPDNAVLPSTKRSRPLRGVSLRSGTPADVEAVIDLLDRCGLTDPSTPATGAGELVEGLSHGTLRLGLAEYRGELVGAAVVRRDGPSGRLLWIATAPRRRRRGVALLLLDALADELRASGCGGLEARLPARDFEAMALLQRGGWARADLLVYTLEL